MALDMFLNMGSTIKGETQDAEFKGAGSIDILAWSWGGSSNASFESGGGGGSGKASFKDVNVTKYIDKASSALMIAMAKGTHIAECKLIIRKGGEGQKKYIEITLDKVMVTGISVGGSGGEDRLTENLRLNYSGVKFEYFTQNEKGATASGGIFNYDVAANQVK